MSKRREGRETAVQLLFSREFAPGEGEHDVEGFFKLHNADRGVRAHAEELYRDVLACLERFEQWRAGGQRIGNVVEDTIRHALPGPGEEADDVWIAAIRAVGDCYATIDHLQNDERWRNLYRCANCSEWFHAWRDPRDSSRPLCSRRCWPSKQPIRSVGPRRRVTTRRTKTP